MRPKTIKERAIGPYNVHIEGTSLEYNYYLYPTDSWNSLANRIFIPHKYEVLGWIKEEYRCFFVQKDVNSHEYYPIDGLMVVQERRKVIL
jgi:hypothetical protein